MSILETLAKRSGAVEIHTRRESTDILFYNHNEAIEFIQYIKSKQYKVIAGPTFVSMNDYMYYTVTVGHRELVYQKES